MEMQQLCLLIVLAPLAAAVIAGLGGRYLGRSGSHWLCIGGVAVSFVASAWFLKQMVDGAPVLNVGVYTWAVSDGIRMEVGFLIDKLTALI